MLDNVYWFTFSLLSNFNKCIQVNTCGKNCKVLRPQLHKEDLCPSKGNATCTAQENTLTISASNGK